MLLSSKPKVSEVIIDTLAGGELDSLVLLEKVQTKMPVTKQGFYRALRELLAEEVVTKNKQLVLLSPVWVNKVQSFMGRLNKTSVQQGSDTLLHLAEGDTMVFRFKSVVDLYLLWTHYFFIFCQETEGPVVFFNSHNFWALLRSDIENEMYAWIKSNKKEAYSVIGYGTPLDRTTSDYLKKDYGIGLAYEDRPSIKETEFPAVFGDYVMSTILDATTVSAINELYKKYPRWEPSVQTELEEIISRMRRSKVVIERNKKKAEQLRKKLMKYFVFYKTD
jgi:hypothetical protein